MTPEEIVAAACPTSSGLFPPRPFVEQLVARLGEDDDLDAAVELAVAQFKRSEAVALMVAAVVCGRPCRAELVGRALWFLPLELLAAVVVEAPGDQLAAVVAALNSDRLAGLETIQACAIALHLHTERHGDGPLEPGLARVLRIVAHTKWSDAASAVLGSVIQSVSDPDVRAASAIHLERFARTGRPPFKLVTKPLGELIYLLLPPSSVVGIVSRPTIRHTTRVGRNEPCPCGSGRKLKKCCIATYEAALADASPVPGLTMLEYKRQAHRHLDEEQLPEALDLFDLAQLPFDELDTDQLIAVYMKLTAGSVCLPAKRALIEIESRSDRGLMGPLEDELLHAARVAGDTETLRWLADRPFRKQNELILCELGLMAPSEGVDAIESILANALRDSEADDEKVRADGSHAISCVIETAARHRPALGLLLARGAIASQTESDVPALMYSVGNARDLLGLRPGDPIVEHVDDLRKDAADGQAELLLEAMRKENARLADDAGKALDALRNARGQSRRIRSRLEDARKQLSELESELDVVTAPDPRIADLQQTVVELECKALELEDDKQTLNAQLSEMEQEFAARQAAPRGQSDPEDIYDHDAAPPTFVRVLVPDWSSAAEADLVGLDPPLAAHTLDVVARVASGRASEGARVKKLKGKADLWSARVGIGHRLLFRFDASAGKLRILHVSARKQLEKLLRGI